MKHDFNDDFDPDDMETSNKDDRKIFILLTALVILILFFVLGSIKCFSQDIKGEMECETSNAIITWDSSIKYNELWLEWRTETGQWSDIGGYQNTGIRKQYIGKRYYYRIYADGFYSNTIMLEPCESNDDYPVIRTSSNTAVRRGIYDMQGRKLKYLPSVPGMYVVDGKKFLVR